MKNFISYLALAIDAIIVFYALKMLWHLIINKFLAFKSVPFSVKRDNALKKVLILGDSVGVGTGANKPEESIAGQLAKDLPFVAIENLAQDGYRTRDLIPIINKIRNKRYDMVIISIGGNDVWHLSFTAKLRSDLEKIIDVAKEMSNDHVLLLLYRNMGSAPFFPLILRLFLRRRAETIRKVFVSTAKERGIVYIDLFTEEKFDPFQKQPKRYFASDKIHPSSEGYKLWYQMMWHYIMEPKRPWHP